MEKKSPSEFYLACRNNNIDDVRRILDQYSVEELDRIESNGSTALHAACYYGHDRIVQLLLERGFTRRTINKYHSTPYQEAPKGLIRDLFKRPDTSYRFGGRIPYEREKRIWILIENNHQNLPQYVLSDAYDGDRLQYGIFHCSGILEELGINMPKLDVIRRLFRRAVEEKDSTRLIQAYTAETDFYRRIDDYLISQNITPNIIIAEFIDTISLNHQLHDQYQFIGISYRTIRIKSHHELNIYYVGAKLINQCFLSTTKDRHFAEEYVRNNQSSQEQQYTVLFSFEIRQKRTALDIEYLSEFPNEKEILILNNKIFKVIHITIKQNLDVEIQLRESKSTRVAKKQEKISVMEMINKQ